MFNPEVVGLLFGSNAGDLGRSKAALWRKPWASIVSAVERPTAIGRSQLVIQKKTCKMRRSAHVNTKGNDKF